MKAPKYFLAPLFGFLFFGATVHATEPVPPKAAPDLSSMLADLLKALQAASAAAADPEIVPVELNGSPSPVSTAPARATRGPLVRKAASG